MPFSEIFSLISILPGFMLSLLQLLVMFPIFSLPTQNIFKPWKTIHIIKSTRLHSKDNFLQTFQGAILIHLWHRRGIFRETNPTPPSLNGRKEIRLTFAVFVQVSTKENGIVVVRILKFMGSLWSCKCSNEKVLLGFLGGANHLCFLSFWTLRTSAPLKEAPT